MHAALGRLDAVGGPDGLTGVSRDADDALAAVTRGGHTWTVVFNPDIHPGDVPAFVTHRVALETSSGAAPFARVSERREGRAATPDTEVHYTVTGLAHNGGGCFFFFFTMFFFFIFIFVFVFFSIRMARECLERHCVDAN